MELTKIQREFLNQTWDGTEYCPECDMETDFVFNPMDGEYITCSHCGKKINGNEEGYGNYVGNVRFGNLCYDIVEWGDHLWFDLYVGGVDTGYGYGVDDYPYDWCDVAGFPWNDYLANTLDDDFKREVEEFIEEHINQFEGYITSIKAIPVDLVAKANEELREW